MAAPDRQLVEPLLDWYGEHARELPWRAPGTSPYAVLVSEVMLQQTPVARVLPAYADWLARWPTLGALADASAGDAVRQWGRLGYPRRALRLHAAARVCRERHDGELPRDVAALRALPGVGEYTAAAVASFAFGEAHPVLDTNVRRVLTRVHDGAATPTTGLRRSEVLRAEALLPGDGRAPRWSVAVMELGALVCTARAPRCGACPIATSCRWLAAGRPVGGPTTSRAGYAGTDREARGAVLALLRASSRPRSLEQLLAAWPRDGEQAGRAVASLLADGLAVRAEGGYALPA